MEIQAKIFDKNISLCPLPLNTNLNYVNASDKNQQNSVFNLTRKRPESKALNLCMWVVSGLGTWMTQEFEAKSDLIALRIN